MPEVVACAGAQSDRVVVTSDTARNGNPAIAAQVDNIWVRLARLIGGEAQAAGSRTHGAASRKANRVPALEVVRGGYTSEPNRASCLTALDAAGIPAAPVQPISEVVADPRFAPRGMIIEQQHSTLRRVRMLILFFHFSDYFAPVSAAIPVFY